MNQLEIGLVQSSNIAKIFSILKKHSSRRSLNLKKGAEWSLVKLHCILIVFPVNAYVANSHVKTFNHVIMWFLFGRKCYWLHSALAGCFNDGHYGHLTDKIKKEESGCCLYYYPRWLYTGFTTVYVSVNKLFKNIICILWIKYMRDEGRKVQCGKFDWISVPSKQLILDCI